MPLDGRFVKRLIATGLLDEASLRKFFESLPETSRPKDSRELAKELVRNGLLTKYQAIEVWQNKYPKIILDDYVLLDKIGEGGMGIVFKARHLRMKRLVAIKTLSPAVMNHPRAKSRFDREVEAAARLSHRNIVTAFDARVCQGLHFLVMEFVEGRTLASIVRETGPLSVAATVHCLLEASRGLSHAHTQGVVHRDIKPSNLIKVDREVDDISGETPKPSSSLTTVKILDMGLARFEERVDENGPGRLTVAGQIIGTIDYMAPEQTIDARQSEPRSDIYSMGCTAFFLLSGRAPFPGQTIAEKVMAHREGRFPSIGNLRSDLPNGFEELVFRMTEKRIEHRPSSMHEVIYDLEQIARRVGGIDRLGSDVRLRTIDDDMKMFLAEISRSTSSAGSDDASDASSSRFSAPSSARVVPASSTIRTTAARPAVPPKKDVKSNVATIAIVVTLIAIVGVAAQTLFVIFGRS